MSEYSGAVAEANRAYASGPQAFNELVERFLEPIPRLHRSDALFAFGNACWNEDQALHPAVEFWLLAKDLFLERGSDLGVAKCASNLAIAHERYGDGTAALEFWHETYRAADMATVLSTLLAYQSAASLALAYYRLRRWDEAILYGREAALVNDDETLPPLLRAKVRMALAMSLYETGGDDEALPHFVEAAALRERQGDVRGAMSAWIMQAQVHHRRKRREAAVEAARRAVGLAEAIADRQRIDEANATLRQVSSSPDPNLETQERPRSSIGQSHPAGETRRLKGAGSLPPRERPTARVFVSSTFRDFYAEREALAKKVFPELRRYCARRGIVFVDVDLRWGITEEQSARGETLPICLKEIDRCRPFFIGLLGERYGSTADFTEALLDQHPWLTDFQDRSITELEILRVVNDRSGERRAFFYFRDPEYAAILPVERRADFVDADPAARQKLRDLKDRIRSSGAPVVENYRDAKALGELVLTQLKASIDAAFPESEDRVDDLEADQEAFAASRTECYVGRKTYVEELDSHIDGSGPPVVVVGERGAGKSALLAEWAKQRREARPQECVVAHFVGAGGDSANWAVLVLRVIEQLNRRLELNLPPPEAPSSLAAAFARALRAAGRRQIEQGSRVVLVLDALDQLDDWGGALDLLWLPENMPEGVRLAVSALPGQSLDATQGRGWPEVSVEELNREERLQVIDLYLGEYGRTLGTARANQIADAEPSKNPLYLRSLLAELKVWGMHERLDERISHYLTASDSCSLFRLILDRYEEDYEEDRPGLVGDAFSLIWAARRGLTESELLEALGSKEEPLPRALWSPLFLAAEPSLVDRAGLFGFSHEHMRQAVKERYVPDPADVHGRLADHFDRPDFDPRSIDELPWQLAQAGRFGRLYALLGDLRFVRLIAERDFVQLKRHWATLERQSSFRMADAYSGLVDRPLADLVAARYVARLLNETGRWAQCGPLYARLIEAFRDNGDQRELRVCLADQANLLVRRGELDEAHDLLQELGSLLKDEREDPRSWENWYGTMAMVEWERNHLDDSWRLLEMQEALLRGLGDKGRLCGCLLQKTFILHVRQEHAQALEILDECQRLSQEIDDFDGLQATLGQMAVNHEGLGDLERAEELLQRQIGLCREIGDSESLAGAIGNVAGLDLKRGNWERALRGFEEMERLGRGIGHARIEHVGHVGRARALLGSGDPRAAEIAMRGVAEFFRTAGMFGLLDLAECVDEQVRRSMRRLQGISVADEIREALGSDRDGNGQPDLDAARRRAADDPQSPEALLALGETLQRAHLTDEAEAAYRRAIALRPGWLEAELKLADLLLSRGFDS